jgi:hypothetical protein
MHPSGEVGQRDRYLVFVDGSIKAARAVYETTALSLHRGT